MKKECYGWKDGADPEKTPWYSPVVSVGDLVFVSGQLAITDEGKLSGATIEEQTRQCLDNLSKQLQRVDLSLEDVVKTTVWLTRQADFPAFNRIYASYFADLPPARATVCCDLAIKEAIIEIDAIAVK